MILGNNNIYYEDVGLLGSSGLGTIFIIIYTIPSIHHYSIDIRIITINLK